MLEEQDYIEAHTQYQEKATDPYIRERLHALLLLSDGYTVEEAAYILRVEVRSVFYWLERYREGGLSGLANKDWGGDRNRERLVPDDYPRLDQLLRETTPPGGTLGSGWTIKQVLLLVKDQFGYEYTASGMKKILRNIGWTYQRSRAKYTKPDDYQEQVERFERVTKEALSEYATEKKK